MKNHKFKSLIVFSIQLIIILLLFVVATYLFIGAKMCINVAANFNAYNFSASIDESVLYYFGAIAMIMIGIFIYVACLWWTTRCCYQLANKWNSNVCTNKHAQIWRKYLRIK